MDDTHIYIIRELTVGPIVTDAKYVIRLFNPVFIRYVREESMSTGTLDPKRIAPRFCGGDKKGPDTTSGPCPSAFDAHIVNV
jgi:hypothetical protein